MEGGCTAPIGAFAEIQNGKMRFVGRLCSLDGKNCIETDDIFEVDENKNHGEEIANQVLNNGGREIMAEIRSQIH